PGSSSKDQLGAIFGPPKLVATTKHIRRKVTCEISNLATSTRHKYNMPLLKIVDRSRLGVERNPTSIRRIGRLRISSLLRHQCGFAVGWQIQLEEIHME